MRAVCFVILAAAATSAPISAAIAQSDPSGYATESHTPQGFQLPDGSGCSGDIGRWRAVQDNDYHTGNIGLPIYHRIQNEIAQAEAACAAGRDAQASALIRTSRARHGYPQ